jgi:hypothetical protein
LAVAGRQSLIKTIAIEKRCTMNRGERQGDIATEPGGFPASDDGRLQRAIWSVATRRIPREQPFAVSHVAMAPRAGDLVLARLDAIGFHGDLQTPSGRTRRLLPGDEIVAVYGNCSTPSQFEAVVPRTIGPCHLVSATGIAGKATSWHSRAARGPTLITPAGFLLRADGERANLADFALDPLARPDGALPPAIAIAGTSPESGTTTTAAFLARGMVRAGFRVGYARVSGTGGDAWLVADAGAAPVLDCVDAGHVSTHGLGVPDLERCFDMLVAHLVRAGVDVMVLEFGDGLLAAETSALLDAASFRAVCNGVMLTATDAMGAAAGVGRLTRRGLRVAGLAGTLSAAPLQGAEALAQTGIATYTQEELARAPVGRSLLAKTKNSRTINGGTDARADAPQNAAELAAGA